MDMLTDMRVKVYDNTRMMSMLRKEVNMNLLNLEYFLIAAEELNFTRAAKRLHIAQQSLSNHIAKLEDHFGTPLFDRNPPMSLTPAGVCFRRYAQQLKTSLDEMEAEIQDIKDFKRSEITIGITRARGAAYLPVLIPKFQKMFPQMRVNLFEDSSANLEMALREAKIDFIIGPPPKENLNIICEDIWQEQYMLIVPSEIMNEYVSDEKNEILEHPENVNLKMFEKCPFVAVQRDLKVGSIFHKYCAEDKMTPNVIMESKNIDIVLSLCMEGLGALVCPDIFLHSYKEKINNRKIFVFPLRYSEKIAISYLENKYLSIGAQKFKEMAKEIGHMNSFVF